MISQKCLKGYKIMKIIFVRHGHPDYKKDCLTERGHPQAEAAAERLKNEKVDKIFSSTCGRAYETAQHIAARHNMDIIQLEFMREIDWGIRGSDDFVHPWDCADEWVLHGNSVVDFDWRNTPDYKDKTFLKNYDIVLNGFDKWVEAFGLQREGDYYRITKENDDTIMMVSHGGSSSAVLSHILNVPFPFVCQTIRPYFTAITVVSFYGKIGELTAPKLELVNDARHTEGLDKENSFGK